MSDPTPAKADETTDLRDEPTFPMGPVYAAPYPQDRGPDDEDDWMVCTKRGNCIVRMLCRCDAETIAADWNRDRATLIAAHAAEMQALRADSASMSSLVRQATAEIMRVELERDGCAALAGSALAENMIVRFLNDRLAAENAVLKAERLKLDKRIRSQRIALRQNWEIVEMRMGTSAHIRLWKYARQRSLDARAAEARAEELQGFLVTQEICADKLKARAEKAERERMPHMCRDDHPEIRHADSGDDERCPVCRERDRADRLATELAEARAALEEIAEHFEEHDEGPRHYDVRWSFHAIQGIARAALPEAITHRETSDA